jgi:hypothetical protein
MCYYSYLDSKNFISGIDSYKFSRLPTYLKPLNLWLEESSGQIVQLYLPKMDAQVYVQKYPKNSIQKN